MGSVDNSGGRDKHFSSNSLSESPIPFSVSSDPHKRLRVRGSVCSVAEGTNRTGSNFFPGSMILFPSLLGPQENGRNETSYRPFYFEYLPCDPPFQNGDQQVHRGFYTPRSLVDIARFSRCLFPLPYFCGFQEIPSLRVGQQSFSVSRSPIRISHSFFGLYQIWQVVSAHLHTLSIQIHSYLDDSLIKELNPDILLSHTQTVIDLLLELGFLISWKKSEIIPSQDSVFLGEHFRTDLGLVFPPEEKLLALRQFILTFLAKTSVTARQFSQLLGLLNSLADVVQLGHLHIRPLQFYLLEHWTPSSQDWDCHDINCNIVESGV